MADRDEYSQDRTKAGKLIIINNVNFIPATKLARREGSENDVQELCDVFSSFGFDVIVHDDMKAADMLRLMIQESNEDQSEYNCFSVAVLTHGSDHGILYGVDKVLRVDSLVAPIKNCKTLIDRPKLFFLQACRGSKLMEGVTPAYAVMGDASCSGFIPLEADFLYAYSTPPGYVAWKNKGKGSWFIQELCDMLRTHSDRMDLLKILTRVNNRVAEYIARNYTHPELSNSVQISSFVSMLRKDVHFTRVGQKPRTNNVVRHNHGAASVDGGQQAAGDQQPST